MMLTLHGAQENCFPYYVERVTSCSQLRSVLFQNKLLLKTEFIINYHSQMSEREHMPFQLAYWFVNKPRLFKRCLQLAALI